MAEVGAEAPGGSVSQSPRLLPDADSIDEVVASLAKFHAVEDSHHLLQVVACSHTGVEVVIRDRFHWGGLDCARNTGV